MSKTGSCNCSMLEDRIMQLRIFETYSKHILDSYCDTKSMCQCSGSECKFVRNENIVKLLLIKNKYTNSCDVNANMHMYSNTIAQGDIFI